MKSEGKQGSEDTNITTIVQKKNICSNYILAFKIYVSLYFTAVFHAKTMVAQVHLHETKNIERFDIAESSRSSSI